MKNVCLVVMLMVAMGITNGVVIYQDDFSGSSDASLNGATPDVGSNTWVASDNWRADGTIQDLSGIGGEATLAFTPVNGRIYEMTLTDITVPSGVWIGCGFADSQTTWEDARWVDTIPPAPEGTSMGTLWMIHRADGAPYEDTSFYGVRTSNGGNLGMWNPGAVDVKILLDTSGATWSATWYEKRPTDTEYTQVRYVADLGTIDIQSVGFCRANDSLGSVGSFMLTETIPEPATMILLGMGSLALLRRKK